MCDDDDAPAPGYSIFRSLGTPTLDVWPGVPDVFGAVPGLLRAPRDVKRGILRGVLTSVPVLPSPPLPKLEVQLRELLGALARLPRDAALCGLDVGHRKPFWHLVTLHRHTVLAR